MQHVSRSPSLVVGIAGKSISHANGTVVRLVVKAEKEAHMQYQKPETTGLLVGLVAVGVSLTLVAFGAVPDLGNWWLGIGVFVFALMVWISYKTSGSPLATILLCGVLALAIINYLVTNFFLPVPKEASGGLIGFWVSMIIDTAIVILSIVWLIMYVKNWLR